MNCENEKYIHRRLSGSNSELRRTRSVRASFRLLGSRWKPLKNHNNDTTLTNKPSNNSKEIKTNHKDYTNQTHHQHLETIKKLSDKVKNHLNNNNNNKNTTKGGKLKTNRKLFQAFSKENVLIDSDMTDTIFLPPKTAAILQIPGSGEDFNRNTCKFLLSSPNLRILKRSESVRSTTAVVGPKTATIRRGSVWANSTLKLTLPDLVTKASSTTSTNKEDIEKQKMAFVISHPPAPRQGGSGFFRSISTTNHMNSNNNNINGAAAQNSAKTRFSSINENNLEISSTKQLLQLRETRQQQNHQQQTKMTKKQLKMAQAQFDKLTQINIHLHALFSAVENGHLEKARTILESTDVDVNSTNSDGLSPLDVAVLSNNRSLTKMLLQYGAIEGSKSKNPDSLGNHLNALLQDAENRIHELGTGAEDLPQLPFSTRASFSSIIGTAYTGPSVTGCTGTEADKQIGLWERRVKGLRRMILGWDQARPPDPPNCVSLDVTSINSVNVRIQETGDGPIATKYRIQWSSRADFSNIVGEREVNEWNSFQGTMGATCRITELTQGRRYFFRVCCGNVKGWGQNRLSIPSSVVPSSWRDMENKEPRFAGRQRILDDLFTAVRLARPDDASEIPIDTPALQRRNPKKKTTIKQLFSAASKFQKNLRRGIYLACILYHEDKVLVTNEDFLPVIEIDETYPSCLHKDFHWLMKVACTWEDVKSLRTDMDRNSTSAVHFRTKLLSAACQMQSALCIQDLGQLFHKPLRDSHGTVVLTCVNNIKSPKFVSVLNSRWIPLNKVQKKLTAIHEDNNINEILLSSIQEQINYNQLSTVKLPKGLYLGYLKMQSSVDQIQIVVPTKTPNVLPHCKIRDNPHISAEEWEFLHRQKTACPYEVNSADRLSDIQELFLESLTHAAHHLFNYMNISAEHAMAHRLYDLEVIELSSEVSFLFVCPPAESSCAVPGHREILLQRGDLLSLSIQAFEMVHLRTYHHGIIQKYSRLYCILELDTILANHSHREAFSSTELQAAKERLAKLQELTMSLNAVWKGVRWLMDVIGFARDRCTYLGLNMKEIFEYQSSSRDDIHAVDEDKLPLGNKRQLLQPPGRGDNKLVKSSPGRGSWPGPTNSSGGLLGAEYSKSDQQLARANLSSRYLSATSGSGGGGVYDTPRKNSADSNFSHSGNSYYSAGESSEHINQRLPPSRSEDTLNVSKKYNQTPMHRKRATTVNSSPLFALKPVYANVDGTIATESLQSLSSDSDHTGAAVSGSVVVPATSTPHKQQVVPSVVRSNDKQRQQNAQKFSDHQQNVNLRIVEDDTDQKPSSSSCGSSGAIAVAGNKENQFHSHIQPASSSTSNSSSSAGSSSTSSSGKSSPEKNTKRKSNTSAIEATSSSSSGIIQVYAAYDTGLANGTSLKLHVTTKTTAREVIDLVVKQLNMAVVLKGKEGPIYSPEKLENFCLVAVIGARERCLRDDFKPLQLQNPWKKGRLYVRQKHDLLAAIEHSNQDAQMI